MIDPNPLELSFCILQNVDVLTDRHPIKRTSEHLWKTSYVRLNTIDASVPEFADQYQYQYQYQKNYWVQYEYQYQYSPNTDSTSTSTTNTEWKCREISTFFERRISFHAENSNFVEQFWTFLSLKFQFERKNMTCFGKLRCRQFFCLIFCFFLRFGTGTDWLSTCVISTSTESVLENWTSTSTSTSVPKMISGLKKSVPVPVDWLIYNCGSFQTSSCNADYASKWARVGIKAAR